MPAGRPRTEFNKKQFEDLVSIGCSEEEICWFFRNENGKIANENTLSRWCQREYGLNFREYRKQNGLQRLRIELRQNQLALSKKSAAMAIWLGKQYLDQKENNEIEDKEAIARLDAILTGLRHGTKSETD